MELLDASVLEWARAQFALTACFHWIFVPLTLGLGIIMSIIETIYVIKKDESWKKAAKFWQTIFGINFAIGVATGIILEFQFGTNWSNYSWFVGDIFGAPLAIEGIVAFFMEATFISIMFFGWNRVGKKTHLASTWLTITGATMSALWILVANAWMQHPVGMELNAGTVRSEMKDFWEVISSPVAISKFLHTVFSAWGLGSAFVVGISSWYLIKKRNQDFALKSMKIASIFGFFAFLLTAYTGDESAYNVAQKQPMKLAAIEGLYEGKSSAGIVALGILNPNKKSYNDNKDPYIFKIEIPKLLSILGYDNANAFVPGIKDIIEGNYTMPNGEKALSFQEKKDRGKKAVNAIAEYQKAMSEKNDAKAKNYQQILKENYPYFGYSYIENADNLIPNTGLLFYSFRIMVGSGIYFLIILAITYIFIRKNKMEKSRLLQKILLWSIPLAYLGSQLGWIIAEVGRQPWAIQDLLPVQAAVSGIPTLNVIITFTMFALTFSALLISEIVIMTRQIKKGPSI